MPYNVLTERQKMARRLTARQALPRNFGNPRNLAVVRHAHPPSNDAGLDFESRSDEVVEAIFQAIQNAPPPAITSPADGSTQTDPLYVISGTSLPLVEVYLHNLDYPDDPAATTRADETGAFAFEGDTPAAEGDTEWWVVAAGKESAHITVTLTAPDP
jgi:hypothetical protein